MAYKNIKVDKVIWILPILFLGLMFSIILRVYAEATNYQSPDSLFYLRAAENILDGKGLLGPTTFPFDQDTEQSYFAIWPMGYPILIALFGMAIPNLLWASKAVNLFFLGASFVILYFQYKPVAIWSSFAYFSYGLTEVYSYTWSEGPFLFFLLLLFYGINLKQSQWRVIIISISLICLFLLRYAGLIFWVFTLVYLVYLYSNKRKAEAGTILVSLIFSGILILGYLSLNYIKTGYITGAERLYLGMESWADFLYYLSRGILNVFAFARNIWFVGSKDLLAIGFLLLQVIVIVFVSIGVKVKFDENHRFMIYSALFYLVMIVCLRAVSPFDKFDYRILSPVFLVVFILFFQVIYHNIGSLKYQRMAIISFVFLSFLINLPIHFLLDNLILVD